MDSNLFSAMPTNPDALRAAEIEWSHFLVAQQATSAVAAQADEAYRQYYHQQQLLGSLDAISATKPLTPCGKNFTLPTSSSTHRPIGGPHDNIGDRRARGHRRTRLDRLTLDVGLRDFGDETDDGDIRIG